MATQTIGTVLIVDDDAKLRFVLTAHLRNSGFEVLEACDGDSAVDMAIQNLPDLIVMDLMMPGTDGIQATQALSKHDATRNIPVIMLTASAKTEDLVMAFDSGAQEYVRKPFDMTELVARVRTVFRLVQARKQVHDLNNQLENEVRIKERQLQILFDYMQTLNDATEKDQILDALIDAIHQITAARRISVLLLDAAGENLVCERALGIDPEIVDTIRVSPTQGISGQVFMSGKTFTAQAVEATGVCDAKYGSNAFVSTPLETRGSIIGVVNATEKTGDPAFTQEEVECLQSIADAGAIALQKVDQSGRLEQSVRVLLRTVGHLAEYRDEETTLHLERVTRLTRILATQLATDSLYGGQFTEDFIESMTLAAPLHDIGKVGIPDEILTKPGKLTPEEFDIMKRHTEIGKRVLSMPLDPSYPVPLLELCVDIAHCHHEKYNGRGYPRGLVGEDIPLSARIIALVDAYDAITSRRRYKAERSHEDAVSIMREERGQHFDPVIVDAFLACHEQFDQIRERYGDTTESLTTTLLQGAIT